MRNQLTDTGEAAGGDIIGDEKKIIACGAQKNAGDDLNPHENRFAKRMIGQESPSCSIFL